MRAFILHNSVVLLFFIYIIVLLSGCDKSIDVENSQNFKSKKELLIYCGTTMIQPMREIADIIEKENDCKIIITKGGSGHLLKSIKINKCGDLYLSGSESCMNLAIEEGFILKEQIICAGANRAAIFVKKGNPLKITSDLNNLIKKEYRVILGAPKSGSIGKETKNILDRFGITNKVYEKVLYLTTDSKGLTNAIIKDQCDIVINWEAISCWKNNSSHISVIKLDAKIAPSKKMLIGVLKFSRYPQIANKILQLIESEEGQAIFTKFGF